jgi:hypothetical protein
MPIWTDYGPETLNQTAPMQFSLGIRPNQTGHSNLNGFNFCTTHVHFKVRIHWSNWKGQCWKLNLGSSAWHWLILILHTVCVVHHIYCSILWVFSYNTVFHYRSNCASGYGILNPWVGLCNFLPLMQTPLELHLVFADFYTLDYS